MKKRNQSYAKKYICAFLGGMFLTPFISSVFAANFSGTLQGVSITDAQASNKAPTASFTSTKSGDAYTFDASGSNDSDGEIVNYNWDFGDGSTSTEKSVTHQYSSPDNYPVTLTVTDNSGGVSLVQQQVTIGGSFYWSMDTLPATSMTSDAGGVTITRYMNAASSVTGYQGNAMGQTGTNQAYTIPMSAVPKNAGTISMYLKHDIIPDSNYRYIFKTESVGIANTLYAYVYKSYVFFYLYDSAGVSHRVYASTSFDSAKWYKYEFVWNGETGYLGIKRDGNILAEIKQSAWPAPVWGEGNAFFIGADWPVGSFDEIRISEQ